LSRHERAPLGLIGGTGFEQAFARAAPPEAVATPYGTVALRRLSLGGRAAVFWSRHGEDHALPPHRIPTRAGLWALRSLGVRRVLATAAVGSLAPDRLPPGTLALVGDAMDFTRGGRAQTYFDGPPLPVVHLEATRLYCPDLGGRLRRAAVDLGMGELAEVVLVVTEGPRLETPAEIRAFARLGAEVVGMTGLPEAALARELGMGYASLAVVTNAAAGLAGPISGRDIDRRAREARARVAALWRRVAAGLGPTPCPCCPPPPQAPPFPWPAPGGRG
jgi:5'-methylthioadenosine phosphorylase